MDWTPEQLEIFDLPAATGHTIINARAGAAKTSTLVELANRLPNAQGLSLAFNAKIRDEMKARMPPNFHAMTLNGCGFDAWRRYINIKCKVNKDKIYNLISAETEKLDKAGATAIWDRFSEIKKAISLAKTSGYLPPPSNPAFRPLASRATFYDTILDFEATDAECDLIDRVLVESWHQTRKGVLDFDDMLLAPAVAGVSFPHYDYVLVDEAQDLSHINHVLLKKIVRGSTRLIAVGDPCQAIYGFRGADSTSMNTLKTTFSADEFFLTASFRCSRAVCENARWRAPDMTSPSWAAEGAIHHLDSWSPADIPDGSAIICRNNAPLFRIAIRLLRARRYPELRGRDIVKTLVAKMRKLGPTKLPRDAAIGALANWLETERQRQRDARTLEDQAECIRIFLNETDNLGDAIAFAQGLATQTGRIYLMTGHGSKGLEFDRVFFLDKHLIKRDRDQDANVEYVILTRAKTDLTYINSDNYKEA